ncbi:hypothetical protein [Streptomyces sp. NRRL F-5630]|uniref:hypothetical protein n=1 Tax=Streptomyces sp. NRRL F-5630 TaxID=1463864 RepID=UPI003EBD7FA1
MSRRLTTPDLRPYLPTPRRLAPLAAGVGAGSLALAARGWGWLLADGWREAGTRAGAVALGGYVGVHAALAAAGPWTPYLGPGAAACWCVAAWRAAPAREAVAEEKPSAEPEPDDDLTREEVAALIRAVAARHEHRGVHLDDLLAEPVFEGWEKPELKAALQSDWGLPVESFKLIFDGRQRVRDGVRLTALPDPVPEALAGAPLEGAPEAAASPLPGPLPAPASGVG